MRYESGHITEIAGYRLIQRLGSGGMGDVYKAYNGALHRTAAIKILHQQEMADRFRNEAYIQSSVSHPNIAALFEYIVSGDMACIIMEYVEGESLDVYGHRKGRLSNAETESIVKQIASALSYLHSRDILHRDIKPQNFKIQADGKVTMLDFGIAKNKYTPKLTQQGFIVGTTEYLAPEQFKQQVEKKSDIWSLGVMTYELLTGYMPFDAGNAVTMRYKIEKGEFTKPSILVPGVSGKLSQMIEKSLQVNPVNRMSASAIEMLFTEKPKPLAESAQAGINKVPVLNRKNLLIAGGAVLLIFVLFFLINSTNIKPDVPGTKEPEQKVSNNPSSPDLEKMTIAVPNVSNAYIVFPDGSSKKLPYDITGKDGENFQFTLQADGYVSRTIEVPITNRRKSYEYPLEKIKE